ncbi:MAG: DUF1549 domain-containing protein, partial [Planctomycetota bacterium]
MALAALAIAARPVPAADIDFNRDIRPILSENCFSCHGQDAKKREADLRLDTREAAVATGAIVPGNGGASTALERIHSTDPDVQMPPPRSNRRLTAEQKDLLERWIAGGAEYAPHWAFVAPVRPAAPPVDRADWPRSDVDRFVLAKIEAAGLAPAPEAERATLIRRLHADLTGLPPTPQEVDAFVADPDPQAYEQLVDRLLASPHYGERMALPWLDAARYADSNGFQQDGDTWQWIWRDWVVKALNDDVPFDRFSIEQLAGDLLPEATVDQQIATGFCRSNVTTSEGGSIDEELVFRYAVDRTATMTNAWLGLTGQCAVCHSHKFDPISQREFYSLYAFFNSAADPGFDGNRRRTAPTLRAPSPTSQERLAAIDRELAPLDAALDAAVAAAGYVDPADRRPPDGKRETVWLADGWPRGADVRTSPGGTAAWIRRQAAGDVHEGEACLDVVAEEPAQVVATAGEGAFKIPEKGELVVHLWLDPANPPGGVMLQLRAVAWNH